MPLIAGAATAGLGAFELIKGASDQKKAKRELSRLHRPLYEVQPEYNINRNEAAVLAGQGLTSAAKDYMTDEAGRGLSAGLGAITQTGGGSINDVTKLTDIYNRSTRQIGAEDAEKQLANIKYFADTNKELAGQKTMKWAINEYQPYQAKLKELQDRQTAAQQNMITGLQTMIGAGSAAATGGQNAGLLKQLFKGTQQNDFGAGGDSSISLRPSNVQNPISLGTNAPDTSQIQLPPL